MAASNGKFLLYQSNSFVSSTRKSFLRICPEKRNVMQIKNKSSPSLKYTLVVKVSSAPSSVVISSNQKINETKIVGQEGIVGLPLMATDMVDRTIKLLRSMFQNRNKLAAQSQILIDKTILDCRFLTLIAVAGSFLGSLICYVEGCLLIAESFLEYFRTFSQSLDDRQTMHFLIEAIDMFLLGTGMLNFGLGLYVMFVNTRNLKRLNSNLHSFPAASNISRRIHQMIIPTTMGTQWLSQAKSKLGHAVMMILQAGAVEKFKNVTVVNAMDLACFAGAILMSSASVFLLSKLVLTPAVQKETDPSTG